MKKLFFIALALLSSINFLSAQESKSNAKPAKTGEKPRQIPVTAVVKPSAVSKEKSNSTAQAATNAPSKEASVNSKPIKNSPEKGAVSKEKVVMKKDGTPDKRYKANQNLKKDGTPDKRFKENKPTETKK
jgi:hypothetical protein